MGCVPVQRQLQVGEEPVVLVLRVGQDVEGVVDGVRGGQPRVVGADGVARAWRRALRVLEHHHCVRGALGRFRERVRLPSHTGRTRLLGLPQSLAARP